MSDYAELIKRLREIASCLESDAEDSDGVLAAVDIDRAIDIREGAHALESLRASLANEQRAREECESRNVFLETEIVQLAERVKQLAERVRKS
jgi:hypothetical protein